MSVTSAIESGAGSIAEHTIEQDDSDVSSLFASLTAPFAGCTRDFSTSLTAIQRDQIADKFQELLRAVEYIDIEKLGDSSLCSLLSKLLIRFCIPMFRHCR